MERKTHKRVTGFIYAGEAVEMAKQCGAVRYYECSSLSGERVYGVFEGATRAALLRYSGERHRSGCCVIL